MSSSKKSESSRENSCVGFFVLWSEALFSLCSVSVCYRHSLQPCAICRHAGCQFQIAGGALLEVWAGGVWVADLPFPFSGEMVLPAWQGRRAAVPAVMLVLLLTRCGFGEWLSRFSGCTQSSLSPHWRHAAGRFFMNWDCESGNFALCTAMCLLVATRELQKRSLCCLFLEHFSKVMS